MASVQSTHSVGNFEKQVENVLCLLQAIAPMDFWMLSRKSENDRIILSAQENPFGLKAGEVVCWDGSICSVMAKGEGPNIAPDTCQVREYAHLPATSKSGIRAYAGVTITIDGELFGTLCGLSREPQSHLLDLEIDILHKCADIIATLAESEVKLHEAKIELLKTNSDFWDSTVYGLLSRQSLNTYVDCLTSESDLGEPNSILYVRVVKSEAADSTKVVADAISASCGLNYIASHYEPGEFVVLSRNASQDMATFFMKGLKSRLNHHGVVTKTAIRTCYGPSEIMNSILSAQGQAHQDIAS